MALNLTQGMNPSSEGNKPLTLENTISEGIGHICAIEHILPNKRINGRHASFKEPDIIFLNDEFAGFYAWISALNPLTCEQDPLVNAVDTVDRFWKVRPKVKIYISSSLNEVMKLLLLSETLYDKTSLTKCSFFYSKMLKIITSRQSVACDFNKWTRTGGSKEGSTRKSLARLEMQTPSITNRIIQGF